MTEERRKYLADISNEERYIRQEIAQLEPEIMLFKGYSKGIRKEVYRASCRYEAFKADKNIIKTLKKHIPQYLYLLEDDPYYQGWRCPTCLYRVLRTYEEMDLTRCYCPSCGQKLLGKNPAY